MASRHVKCNIIIRELEVGKRWSEEKYTPGMTQKLLAPVSCSFKQCSIKGQNNETDKRDGENDKTEDRFLSRKNI